MRLFQDFLDQSKQLNQAQKPIKLCCHPPQDRYKIIHQKLVLANLPAPLHYLNFFSLIGQPNSPVFCNYHEISTTALDTATLLVSSSPHMVGQLSSYSIQRECQFHINEDNNVTYAFGQKEKVFGQIPDFTIQRQDDELSLDLNITTMPLISHFIHLKFGFAQHWSVVAHCKGIIQYKKQTYEIEQNAVFEYMKAANFPYLPYALYIYQLIQVHDDLQLICMHSRDQMNHILYSRIYIRDTQSNTTKILDRQVSFKVHRVFPKVTTINHQEMYLPREFEWQYQDENINIDIQAQSRGDYKFGLAAGYVGSFIYQLHFNGEYYQGEGGYSEYIDCRPLKWQEIDKEQKLSSQLNNPALIMLKK